MREQLQLARLVDRLTNSQHHACLFGVNYLDRSATIILAGVMGFDSATSLD